MNKTLNKDGKETIVKMLYIGEENGKHRKKRFTLSLYDAKVGTIPCPVWILNVDSVKCGDRIDYIRADRYPDEDRFLTLWDTCKGTIDRVNEDLYLFIDKV